MLMSSKPLILFFNRFFDDWPDLEDLPCQDRCHFSTDPGDMAAADAVIFHLPRLQGFSKLAKPSGQLWVAWSMESPRAYPIMAEKDVMRRFDLRMTYQQDADVWVPYLDTVDIDGLRRPPPKKTEASPVVRFQSSRFDVSGRNRFSASLMTRVKIDSYGALDNNRNLEAADLGRESKLETISRYKFATAFENAIEPDYVTEKFFEPLMAGTVPVYLGAPNIAEFAPGDHCFINVADFGSVGDLAKYLNELDQDDEAYQAYFAWKTRALRPEFMAMHARAQENNFCRLCDIVRDRCNK